MLRGTQQRARARPGGEARPSKPTWGAGAGLIPEAPPGFLPVAAPPGARGPSGATPRAAHHRGPHPAGWPPREGGSGSPQTWPAPSPLRRPPQRRPGPEKGQCTARTRVLSCARTAQACAPSCGSPWVPSADRAPCPPQHGGPARGRSVCRVGSRAPADDAGGRGQGGAGRAIVGASVGGGEARNAPVDPRL